MMIRKLTFLGCALVTTLNLATGCSDDQGLGAPSMTGTAGSSGSGGTRGETGGTTGTGTTGGGAGSGSGGAAGSQDGGAGSAGTAGTGGGGTGPGGGTGACGPLRGADPTDASVQTKGTFTVMSYTDSPASTAYKASTIYYPADATPPFVGVAAVPGFNGTQSSVNQWGSFLASHGYAVIVIDTNSTGDSPTQRSTALMAAVETLKGENARAGSALNGKIGTCMVVMGHSMGGGGAVMAANTNSDALKGAIGLSPYGAATSSTTVKVPTLLFVSTSDPLATPAGHVKPAYQGIAAGTNKMYLEFPGGAHDIAQYPNNTRATDPIVARYGLAWLKFNVDGDARYRPFLDKVSTGLADYQTTLP